MSYTHSFRYKCRRCKTEFTDSCAGGNKSRPVMLAMDAMYGNEKEPMAPSMYTLHLCSGPAVFEQFGIADFVGFNTEKKESKE